MRSRGQVQVCSDSCGNLASILENGKKTLIILPRRIDGSCNNVDNPNWGSSHMPLVRIVGAQYADEVGEPRGTFKSSVEPGTTTGKVGHHISMMSTMEGGYLRT